MLKNLVYFGSPDFSARILESVLASNLVNVVGVVTTPDTPQGRKQVITPSPVNLVAQKHGLPIYKPSKLDDSNLTHIKLLKPDIFLAVSYGKIIPKTWIDTPTIGTFNVHFSLLPKYRGALCISETIKNQDTFTGVTLMEMDEKLDHGPIISQVHVAINIDDNVATLTTKLTQAAQEILRQKLPEICAQNYPKTAQDESLAVFTPSHRTLTHESAFLPWETISPCLTNDSSILSSSRRRGSINCKTTHALIRSLNPEPGAWTKIPSRHSECSRSLPAGRQGSHSIEIKILQTSLISGKLIIDTVQIAGKNPISWQQFLSGHPITDLK